MTPFEEGVLYAAATLHRIHRVPTMAADLIREAGLGKRDCSGLDDFDKEALRQICDEGGGLQLTGLDN